jgi:acetyl esterase/lipase
MPIGYLLTMGLVVAAILLALRPPRRPRWLGIVGWMLSAFVNESPFLGLYWMLVATLLAFTQGDLVTPIAWAAFGLSLVSFVVGVPILIGRSMQTRRVLDEAFDRALGNGWRSAIDPVAQLPVRLPWARIVLAPLPIGWGVKRTANLSYGAGGRRNRLDVYRSRRGPTLGAPMLIHLHGGGFRTGRKNFYARALLHEFARHGWICISANYRLRPATFPDFLADAKKVIAWARNHADDYGADPTCIVIAGSSAGAHLAVSAALTANNPAYQPGFEDTDTSVAAAIGLYGYYGPIESGPLPSSPAQFAHSGAPPLLIAHGNQDTYVPSEHARQLATQLRDGSLNPVVYAELPGGQHTFDMFHSIRFEILIDGLQLFTTWIRSRPRAATTSDAPTATSR